MQNREVPLGSLPIFFSSLRLAEAGRTCPEVRGGRQGAEHGQPSAGRRRRSHGRGVRGAGDGGTGAGCGAAGAGCGPRGAGAEHGRRGRGAQDAKRGTRGRGRGRGRGHGHGGTGCRTQDAGRRTQDAERRTQNTGYWPRAAEHGKRGHEVQKTEDAGTGCRTQNTGYWPRAAEHGKRGHGAQETGHRRRGTSPRAWTAARLHTPARPRNNLPGPFTAGRHPPPGPIRRDLSRLDARRRDPQQPAGPFTAGRHPPPGPATTRRGRPQPGAFRRGPHPTCRAYESESRRCRRARRTCCCRAAPRPT